MRMVVNVIFLSPYIYILMNSENSAASDRPIWPLLLLIAWGFIGFRWLMDAFHRVTGLIIFDTLQGWGKTYFIGSVITGIFGFIVIPIILVLQLIQLMRVAKA